MKSTQLAETFISEEKQRFLQALPVILSFCLTLYMPIAARKSLSAWRALQVYDSQEPPKKGFTGERKRTRWEMYLLYVCRFSPTLLQIIAFIPVNETKWPIYSTIRRSIPFVLLAILLSISSLCVLYPFATSVERVGRDLEPIADKKTNAKKASNISLTRDTTKKQSGLANLILLFSVLMPISVASYFAHSSDSILVVVVIGIASTLATIPGLVTPLALSKVHSLRSNVKHTVLIFLGAIGLFLAVFVISFCGAYLYLTYFASTKSSSSSKSKDSKTDENVDVVMSQMVCLIYTAIWPIWFVFPAYLMNLAYRFDVSKAGLTQVTDEQKKEAIQESREVAKHCIVSKHPNHDYDNVGRTPILLDSIALRLPNQIKESDLPIFSTTMKTMIAVQASTLLIITWAFLPSWFNIPVFVRSQQQADVFPFPLTLNFSILLANFVMVPVMLFSAGYHAKKNGQTFGSGVRAIWTYEENWGADYYQTMIDHQMDLEDDEKDENLLADITKEDFLDKEDLNV